MKRLAIILHSAELITKHVVGKDHTATHRRVTGSVIMAFGVWLAHAGSHYHPLIAIPIDLIGYCFHAIGFIPFIKSIENADHNK